MNSDSLQIDAEIALLVLSFQEEFGKNITLSKAPIRFRLKCHPKD
jgi:hypothetical protein